VLSRIPVDLEERDVGEVGRGDFDNLSSIFGERAANSRPSNDAAEFEDTDSGKDLRFAG
jgi:hypothetical protein